MKFAHKVGKKTGEIRQRKQGILPGSNFACPDSESIPPGFPVLHSKDLVNRYGTRVFSATDPAGPWEHRTMNARLHSLTVLFDDDGQI